MNGSDAYQKNGLLLLIIILGIVIALYLRPYIGGILGAITLYTLIRRQLFLLTQNRKWRHSWAAIVLLIEAILCFLIPLTLAGWLVIDRLQGLDLNPSGILEPLRHADAIIREKTGYDLLAPEHLTSLAASATKAGQWLMERISGFGINILILIFVLYFMLLGGLRMERYLFGLLPFRIDDRRKIVHAMRLNIQSNAIGVPVVALLQGVIALVGYLIFKVPEAWLLGLLTSVASIVPIVGTLLVWGPLVLYMGLTGEWGHALGLLAYAVIIISQSENLIRFFLQKRMANIPPPITVFGVVIGLPLFGFMGVVFGPLLLSLFALLVDLFKREYLQSTGDSKGKDHSVERSIRS